MSNIELTADEQTRVDRFKQEGFAVRVMPVGILDVHAGNGAGACALRDDLCFVYGSAADVAQASTDKPAPTDAQLAVSYLCDNYHIDEIAVMFLNATSGPEFQRVVDLAKKS